MGHRVLQIVPTHTPVEDGQNMYRRLLENGQLLVLGLIPVVD